MCTKSDRLFVSSDIFTWNRGIKNSKKRQESILVTFGVPVLDFAQAVWRMRNESGHGSDAGSRVVGTKHVRVEELHAIISATL
jgi:hypothetical protein